MNAMRELTMNELDAVSGGQTVKCTVTKAVTVLGWTFGEAKCENGQTIKIIQPPA
jgi:bacteriocin-like protein